MGRSKRKKLKAEGENSELVKPVSFSSTCGAVLVKFTFNFVLERACVRVCACACQLLFMDPIAEFV